MDYGDKPTGNIKVPTDIDETQHQWQGRQGEITDTGKTEGLEIFSHWEPTQITDQARTPQKSGSNEKEPPKYYLMYTKIRIPTSLAKYADRYMCSGCDFFMDSRKQFRRHERLFRKCKKVNDRMNWDNYKKRPASLKRVAESEPESDGEEKDLPPKRIKKLPLSYYWNGIDRDPLNLKELISKANVNVHDKTK